MTATRLTEKQLTALTWIAGGATGGATATAMGISLTAVNGLLYQVRLRLGAENTTHAVALAYQRGYLAVDQPAVS